MSRSGMRVYQSNGQLGWGPSVWVEMFQEIFQSRELIYRFFLRNFVSRYKQSVLGLLWVFIMPLVTVGLFIVLGSSGVLNLGQSEIPYPIYALVGLTAWQLFSGGLAACSGAIVGAGGMVGKVSFPREALVFAAFGQALVETTIKVGLVVAVFALYGFLPPWTALLFPIMLIPLSLLTLGLGMFAALIAVIIRDIPHIVSLFNTFLLLVTPILYQRHTEGLLATITSFNPVAPLVIGVRDIVIYGHLSQPGGFVWVSILSALFFLIAWRIFHLVEPRMAERL